MNNILKNFIGLAGKARLYTRVGLKCLSPLKAYRMLRYWILTNVFKRRIPWVMEFSLTYRCQCRCKHCSVSNYFSDAKRREELTTDQIKKVLIQAVRMGVPKVDYFGGEPLLRKDIVDLVKLGASLGLYISITTNGWLLTKAMTRELKRAGISCINVSLDSTSSQKHDQLRGLPGLYKRATEAIRYCYEEGIPCIVSTYVTRNRLRNFASGEKDDSELTKIISLSRKLRATAIRILFPIISGEWVTKKKVELTEEEKRKVIDYIDPSFAFIEGAFSIRKKKKVCQSLSGKMFNISPYGEIQLCVAFPDVFGNVKEAPLERLVRGMYAHPVYLKNKNGDCCSTTELKR